MKTLKNIFILAFLYLLIPFQMWSQECATYHELGDCMLDRDKNYKIYSQSKSADITVMDTVEFNVIFYGQKDYIFSFCTHRKFYPVNFRLLELETREVLYDNAQDKFIESLGIGFDVTKSLIIQVNVLARKATPEEIENSTGCVGLLIQYKNYTEKSVNLKM